MQENLKSAGKGFEKLLGVHTRALEDNSKSVVEILELLSQKQLSVKDKNVLKKINRELKGIDKVLDSLGKDSEEEQEDWFGF